MFFDSLYILEIRKYISKIRKTNSKLKKVHIFILYGVKHY